MTEITLQTGFGVQRDADGRIVSRLNLPPGNHEFPDRHSVEEFDSFDAVLALDWPPEPALSLSSESITADGADEVTVTVEMVAESSREWGPATLRIAGDAYTVDVSNGSASQTLTTTTSDASILIEVEHPDWGTDAASLEVVQP